MRTFTELIVAAGRWFGQLMVTATIRAVVIGLAGMGLIWFSVGANWGKIPVVLGFVMVGGATLYWLLITILPRTAVDKATQRFPTFGANLQGLYALGFAYFIAIATIVISDISLYPKLVLGLVLLLVGLGLSVAAPGVAKKLSVFNWRMGIGMAAVTVAFLWVHLPAQTQSRISFGAKTVSGMKPNRIPFTLESLKVGNPPFFRSIPNSDGKSEPAVWAYFDEEAKVYYLYDGPGSFENNGDPLVPADRNLRKKIMDYLENQQAQKVAEDKKTADEQKAVADVEAAKVKAEEDRKLKTQQVANETARREQQEREATARERAEIERNARLAAQEEQRQLASQPITLATTILAPTDQTQDIVVVRPSVPFTYRGVVMQPDQSLVQLDITDVKPAAEKDKYALTLQPKLLISGGQKYDISNQSGIIQFIAQKDSSRSLLKILGGAAVGAGVGAIVGGKKGAAEGAVIGGVAGTVFAVASHGQKFQLTVGDKVPPIIIKPAL